MNKPLYAIVNAKTGEAQGDAYTLKSEAQSHVSVLNRLCRRESKSGSMLVQYKVASVHPEMAERLTVNPYSRNGGCGL